MGSTPVSRCPATRLAEPERTARCRRDRPSCTVDPAHTQQKDGTRASASTSASCPVWQALGQYLQHHLQHLPTANRKCVTKGAASAAARNPHLTGNSFTHSTRCWVHTPAVAVISQPAAPSHPPVPLTRGQQPQCHGRSCSRPEPEAAPPAPLPPTPGRRRRQSGASLCRQWPHGPAVTWQQEPQVLLGPPSSSLDVAQHQPQVQQQRVHLSS